VLSAEAASDEDRQRQAQTQALLMQVPAPNFPCAKQVAKQPAVHAVLSHVGGGVVQLPPTQVAPLLQSLSAQQAAEQTQALPDFT
jgi:hypothetical protein